MIKVINAHPGIATPLTEEDTKRFLANYKNLFMHIGILDRKGEPNMFPTSYHFDGSTNKIYIQTHKSSKKVENLIKNNIVSFCADDPNPPYKGVRGKGTVEMDEDISHNLSIAEKLLMKSLGTLEHPMARWLLNETEKGKRVILEITPSYYSTWDYGKSDLV
jgi:nitroimidazol reductase NimA-like FMN-containing flavoprotein (pyridoxamine 5'-phosphate oxidase superfamily)